MPCPAVTLLALREEDPQGLEGHARTTLSSTLPSAFFDRGMVPRPPLRAFPAASQLAVACAVLCLRPSFVPLAALPGGAGGLSKAGAAAAPAPWHPDPPDLFSASAACVHPPRYYHTQKERRSILPHPPGCTPHGPMVSDCALM